VSYDADFDIKERVRSANDIAEVVGSYLEMRRQGSNFVALCPWHDDTKPSLQINPVRQTWKCWPCNIGGDVFSFIQQRESVDFGEAIKILADRAGIEITRFKRKALPAGSPGDKQTLFAAMKWVNDQFSRCLNDAPEAGDARRYLAARGINQQCVEQFSIGYAPDAWSWITDRAKNTPYSPQVFEACGLLIKNDKGHRYSRFRGRVMFPILDIQDRVIAFGGRILPEIAEAQEKETGQTAAKYINSPETRLFSKSDTLYGLNIARKSVGKKDRLIVVEGYTDVIAAWQAGIENVVAVLGVALNDRHIRLLKRHSNQIILVLDGDQAGVKRANEILDIFVSAEVDLRIMTLPDGLDPNDYLQQNGAASFRELVESAPDALDHKISVETKSIDLINDTHRSNAALENILRVLARSPRSSTETRVRSEQLVTRLGRMFGLDQSSIRQRLKSISSRQIPGFAREQAPESPSANSLTWKERELLQLLASEPEFLDAIIENISPNQFVEGPGRNVYELYCECFSSGIEPNLHNVLNLIEDTSLKTLLVDLDEEGQTKKAQTEFEPQQRLDDVMRAFEIDLLQSSTRESKSLLASKKLDNQEEESTLLELLEKMRRRQGL